MQMRIALVAALVLAVVGLPGHPALAATTGTISGQVTSATAGAPVPGVTEVILHAFAKATGDETGSATATRTDASGRFSFEGVDTSGDRGYVVTADHAGVTYSSDLVIFGAGETSATANVEVYETTGAGDWIWLRQEHLIVTPDLAAGTLHVLEIAIVENAGDSTFVGADRGSGVETVRLPLPSGAREVAMDQPLARSAAMQPGTIVYRGPVLPGQTQLVLAYVLPYSGGSYTLPAKLALDADALDVLVEDTGLAATSAQLDGPTTAEASGKRYLRLTGHGIAAGTVVEIRLFRLGLAEAVASATRSLGVPGALGAALLAVLVVIGVVRLRRPAKHDETDLERP